MKIWFDTEFIEDGRTIELISIGMVREDGQTLYRENSICDHGRANHWVKENVIHHLIGGQALATPAMIGKAIVDFAGFEPEFWAYYCSYDWVVLCQLYGTMMDLPDSWPMWCRDIKQLCVDVGDPRLPRQTNRMHHALDDALWTQQAWRFLAERNLEKRPG